MELNTIINYTPLANTSKNGQTNVVRLLLSAPGIEVNCADI